MRQGGYVRSPWLQYLMHKAIQSYRMETSSISRPDSFALPKLKTAESYSSPSSISAKNRSSQPSIPASQAGKRQDQTYSLNTLSKYKESMGNNSSAYTPLEIVKQSRRKSSNFGTLNSEYRLKVQFKYMSRSPEYFKKKERSMQLLQPQPSHDLRDKKPDNLEKQRDLKMKQFNKNSLISLAKQGIYKNLAYKHKVIPKKKSGDPITSILNQDIKKNSNMDTIEQANQTKYSKFSPTRIGLLMHSLQKIYPSNHISL